MATSNFPTAFRATGTLRDTIAPSGVLLYPVPVELKSAKRMFTPSDLKTAPESLDSLFELPLNAPFSSATHLLLQQNFFHPFLTLDGTTDASYIQEEVMARGRHQRTVWAREEPEVPSSGGRYV
ncbi:hypothetical protein PENFLA_c010G01272 [Penicillium flavigenum]|uniref:Uncharacterized protein n=1 Tax=Penicillium flavigenum TaxID=254877 RepID=A0A1V6TDV2_9EURO|nr:hypothetical protein PENFLA_c010G01272 [Penicillium flavigenum]